MNTKIIFLFSLGILLISSSIAAQTKIIAHRGYWDTEGSAQNSIAALKKAQEIGVYGSEFDVILTKDGVPVVNHDNAIAGFDIQESDYKTLKNTRLKNGEKLPTLEQYLKQGKKNKNTRLILEIKPHKSREAEERAVKTVVAMVNQMKVSNLVEYISFSLFICKELHRLSPESPIALLNGTLSPSELKAIGLTGLDYNQNLLNEKPEWIQEAKQLGLTVNVWTVNNPEMMRSFINQGVDYITTDKPVEGIYVRWDTPLILPSSDGATANIGLAGVYSGLTGNKLLILGGSNFPELPPWEGGKKFWRTDLYCYDTIQKQWKVQKKFLESGRAYGLSIQLEEGFIGIGGCDEKQCYKTVFFVKSKENSIICDTTIYPPLPVTLANMSGALLNNKIYIAGGQETVVNGKSSKHFLMLDISAEKKEWIELPCWPGYSLAFSVCAAQSGKFFLFGGRSFGPDEETVMHTEGYCFNPETNEWKTLSGQFPVMAGTAMPFDKNKILFFGGVPEILPTSPSHPGFSSEVLLFDTQKETLEKISTSDISIPVTTHLLHHDNYFFITSGEIKPGVRTPYILRGHVKQGH